MQKTTTALETPLREQLDRLASFEGTDAQVLSLYLDQRPDAEGRRSQRDAFLKNTFPDRIRGLQGDARKSAERDVERIREFLAADARTSAAGLAIFASAGHDDFFEAVQLDAPVESNWLFIGSVPHLYPLSMLNDQYPRYAALLMDTNSARLFVFGLGSTETQRRISNVKTRRSSMGGSSQARYQRHVENFHLHHVKEVVGVLDQVVRNERINQIVVSCEDVARPILMEHLPKHLAEKIVDVRLGMRTPEDQVMSDTLEALREKDRTTDAEHVEATLGAWRAGGLGVVGPEKTLDALVKGQVEELLITAVADPGGLKMPNELVTKAQQTAARIRFIEDPNLLAEVGGVGALLRFRI